MNEQAPPPRPSAAPDPYRPFRPRAARVVAWVLAVAVVGMVVTITTLLPPTSPWNGPGERFGIVSFGVLVASFLLLHARVRADPDQDGLVVRNLLLTRRLTWTQIVSVRFGPDRPWVQLDLDDGTTMAVMAVQAADGRFAQAEARRLATLVARRSATPRDD
jgi:hypothetical protein